MTNILRQVRDFDIPSCIIVSNDKTNKKDIANIITDLFYYESILEPSIRVTLNYVDTGNAVDVDRSTKTLLEGLPIVGEENIDLKLKDANGIQLNLPLYVNRPIPIKQDTTKSFVSLELASKEYILNEKVRVNTRFDGKISEHIKRILRDFLKTDKKINIETTANNYNFMGNNKKPFYNCLLISKKAIPLKTKLGNSAGFFFWETSNGFNFKSVDSLLSDMDSGNKKNYKSFIFTNTPERAGETIPKGYSGKILEFTPLDVAGDIQSKLELGTYTTRTITFDPVTCSYQIINTKSSETEQYINIAGRRFPKFNPEFDIPGLNKDFSRTQYFIIDKGVLPSGNVEEQLKKSKQENLDAKNIISQSIMRYNQIYSSKVTITIVADLSLHAGDLIYIDYPELSNKEDKSLSDQFGGFYVIADLCHYYNISNGAYTKLFLIRDSLGKRGTPTLNR